MSQQYREQNPWLWPLLTTCKYYYIVNIYSFSLTECCNIDKDQEVPDTHIQDDNVDEQNEQRVPDIGSA
jgi:hypothetical protein